MTTDDGQEIEFPRSRETRPTLVVPKKTATWALILGVLSGAGGSAGMGHFVFKAAVQEQIQLHNQSADAHIGLIRTLDAQRASDEAKDATIARLTVQIDGLQRDVRDLRETIVELKTVIKSRARQ